MVTKKTVDRPLQKKFQVTQKSQNLNLWAGVMLLAMLGSEFYIESLYWIWIYKISRHNYVNELI